MSGIAIAAPTTPGSVATFSSCSSEWSPPISSRISASAKIRAGTRMSSREELGISHVVSSIRCRSDIENDEPAPDPVLRSEAKTVERHGLDERSRLADVTAERCADLGARERELRSLGDESLGLG